MKAVTWQGFRDISVEEVADPVIKEPNDAIIKVTSTNICGSDLHLYETMGAFMSPGDVLGHEAMGIVLEVGAISLKSAPATGSWCRSRSPADTAGCASDSSIPSARRLRYAGKAVVPRSSATPSYTAKCLAARPSTSGCRKHSSPTSWCRRARRTTISSISLMYCRPLGRRWSTRRYRMEVRCWSWDWDRSAIWHAG